MYEFLAEIDNSEILVLATTNQLDKIDKAIRRGGRLDIDVRMEMPSDNDRYLIFKEHFRNLPNNIEDQDLLMISRASSGFVSSDIAQIVRNCHLKAIKNHREAIILKDLEE